MCISSMKTIKVSDKNWKKLMQWKLDLGLKNLDEIIERILKINTAKELYEGEENETAK